MQYKLQESKRALETYKDMVLDQFQLHSLCGWTSFNYDLQNYLASMQGISGVPLSYVIWKEEF